MKMTNEKNDWYGEVAVIERLVIKENSKSEKWLIQGVGRC